MVDGYLVEGVIFLGCFGGEILVGLVCLIIRRYLVLFFYRVVFISDRKDDVYRRGSIDMYIRFVDRRLVIILG